jgi:hypothetical protein
MNVVHAGPKYQNTIHKILRHNSASPSISSSCCIHRFGMFYCRLILPSSAGFCRLGSPIAQCFVAFYHLPKAFRATTCFSGPSETRRHLNIRARHLAENMWLARRQSRMTIVSEKQNVIHEFHVCFSTGDRTIACSSCGVRCSSISLSHRKRGRSDNRTIVGFDSSPPLD